MTDGTIGVLSAGEMGSSIGAALRGSGARVVTYLGGRSAATVQRAADAGMEGLPSLEAMARESDLIVTVLHPATAEPVARQVAEAVRAVGARPLYLDANAIAPATAQRIGGWLEPAGVSFVDGSIVGSAATVARKGTVFLSGPRAEEVARWLTPALQVKVLSEVVGHASGFKALYAGMTKGITALGVELLAAAEALGLRDVLLEQYAASLPSVAQFLGRTLPDLAPRAERRAQEMNELSELLGTLGHTPRMARAAQATLEQVGEAYGRLGPPDEESMAASLAWLARAAEGQARAAAGGRP